jgi:lactoylglutathione lyase
MSASVEFQSVHPIGETDTSALPAKSLGPAVGYYVHVLGFQVVEKEKGRAILQRDGAKIGLAENGSDPEQASCYFAVSDVEALHQELEAKGIEPSAVDIMEHGGKNYRVCFARDPYGICFCFGQPA